VRAGLKRELWARVSGSCGEDGVDRGPRCRCMGTHEGERFSADRPGPLYRGRAGHAREGKRHRQVGPAWQKKRGGGCARARAGPGGPNGRGGGLAGLL
jgi:hypothetical protein